MDLKIQEKLEEVKKYNQRISELGKLSSLAYWDMKMSMPSKATEQRASTLGFLSGEIFKMVTVSYTHLDVYKRQCHYCTIYIYRSYCYC